MKSPLKNVPTIYNVVGKTTLVLFSFAIATAIFLLGYFIGEIVEILGGPMILIFILIIISKFYVDFFDSKDFLKRISAPRILCIEDLTPGIYEIKNIMEIKPRKENSEREYIVIAKIPGGLSDFAIKVNDGSFWNIDFRSIDFPKTVVLEGRTYFTQEGKKKEYSMFVPYEKEITNNLDG